MGKRNNTTGNPQLRSMLIRESARLMYEEGVTQYHTAKWRAAKNILGRGCGSRKIRPADLPSNGEISEASYALAQLYEGDSHSDRLFAMRIAALDVLAQLEAFSPRLIGSVSTGRVKKTSDIDIHVFTDCLPTLEKHLSVCGWDVSKELVCIRYQGSIREFRHIYFAHQFPVELSVYPVNGIRVCGRSSTDGLPIERYSYNRLLKLLELEHSRSWQRYLADNG